MFRQVIQFLLKKGDDTHLQDQDKNGWSPLQCAASAGHLVVIFDLWLLICTFFVLFFVILLKS
jgi:ankyrin repeat protein